jgi:penicillin G amidase
MRFLFFFLSAAVTIALVIILDTTKLLPAPLGKLLSPQEGLWQNAENVNSDFDADLRIPGLKGNTEVYLDNRMVPHIFSDNDEDAYFVQGYLHAKFRLWQMEFQTLGISGRISEIIGDKAVNYDRRQRRLGITYAAEKTLKMWEEDEEVKSICDAYTAGVNAYIENLPASALPVEYKLLGYKPEKWTNYKTVLFFEAMTYDLAGRNDDFEQTNLLRILGETDYKMLFPEFQDSLSPIIPKGIPFTRSADIPLAPANADSVYFHRRDSIWFTEQFKPDPDNGSNNWVVSGTKTKSGKPILCNDPHLGLNLPPIWFEIQINTPSYNAYGVSFPGLPSVVIGFNENVAFGFTNAGRDMMDFYEIRFRDQSRTEYWFNNEWKKADLRIEQINIKGQPAYQDTVAYTVFGPVTYDQTFQDKLKQNKAFALTWIAHYPSSPLKMWKRLNHAKNYTDYIDALQYFKYPSQNIVFASKDGDIAIKQEGDFPLRWEGQGDFVMPGTDSSYMWKGFIPRQDNPFIHNPEQGYISSANQRPVDSSYPYFIPGSYDMYRGISINRRLSVMTDITPDDMKKLQNDNYDVFSEQIRPSLLRYLQREKLSPEASKYADMVEKWSLWRDIDETAPTVIDYWVDSLSAYIFRDEIAKNELPVMYPDDYILAQYLIRDTTSFKFIDNINTPQVESLQDAVTASLEKATEQLKKLEADDKLTWGKYKNTTVYHLLKTNMMPFAKQGLPIGGGQNIINATKHDHGPSWRMVVHLTTPVEAYGIYPGGQNGNPGSPFYDNMAMDWAKGQYYKLWIMKKNEKGDRRIKGSMKFSS